MSVLILGENQINKTLENHIKKEGFQTNVINDVNDIVSIKGEPGEYLIKTKADEYVVSSVIITEPYNMGDVIVNEGKTKNITEPYLLSNLSKVKGKEKIVFLLDYITETPEYITITALKMAKSLVEQKKEVIFLSKIVKTLSNNVEKLYHDARNSGILFVKYDELKLDFTEETGKFTINFSDGMFSSTIVTPYVVSEGGRIDGNLNKLTKKIRLSLHNKGLINEDRFFLSPTLTSRKGIFYFNPNVATGNPLAGLNVALPEIDEIIEDNFIEDEDLFIHAVVDPRKCAFCYTCYRACPHAAMEPDLENSAMINTTTACEACGVCVSVCPAEAIYINDEEGLVSDEIKPGTSNKCKVFCCENSAAQAFEEISSSIAEYAYKLDIASIPCGGRLSLEMITTALSTYDKVLVAVCMDDACRHFGGGKRACLQMEKTESMLKKAEIGGKFVKCVKVSHVMGNVLKEEIEGFLEK